MVSIRRASAACGSAVREGAALVGVVVLLPPCPPPVQAAVTRANTNATTATVAILSRTVASSSMHSLSVQEEGAAPLGHSMSAKGVREKVSVFVGQCRLGATRELVLLIGS
jgi:hypothetical protein